MSTSVCVCVYVCVCMCVCGLLELFANELCAIDRVIHDKLKSIYFERLEDTCATRTSARHKSTRTFFATHSKISLQLLQNLFAVLSPGRLSLYRRRSFSLSLFLSPSSFLSHYFPQISIADVVIDVTMARKPSTSTQLRELAILQNVFNATFCNVKARVSYMIQQTCTNTVQLTTGYERLQTFPI